MPGDHLLRAFWLCGGNELKSEAGFFLMFSILKKLFGLFLGFAFLLLGLITPIVTLAGLSGMIWGGYVIEGHLPKDHPAYLFGLYTLVPAMLFGGIVSLCFLVLPTFAIFDVPVAGKDIRSKQGFALARLMKRVAGYYSALMDKIIRQEET